MLYSVPWHPAIRVFAGFGFARSHQALFKGANALRLQLSVGLRPLGELGFVGFARSNRFRKRLTGKRFDDTSRELDRTSLVTSTPLDLGEHVPRLGVAERIGMRGVELRKSARDVPSGLGVTSKVSETLRTRTEVARQVLSGLPFAVEDRDRAVEMGDSAGAMLLAICPTQSVFDPGHDVVRRIGQLGLRAHQVATGIVVVVARRLEIRETDIRPA